MADGQPTVPTTPQEPTYDAASQFLAGVQTVPSMQQPVYQGLSQGDMTPMTMQQMWGQVSQLLAGGPQVPGATQPFKAAPASAEALGIRMPAEARVRPERPEQAIPYGGTTDQIRAAEMGNLFNTIGNAAGRIANEKAQEKHQEQVGTIKDFMNALTQAQEAQRVLKNDPNNADALAVFNQSKAMITKIKGDNKQWKVIQNAMPNYIDPSENNKPEVRAGQQAAQEHMIADKAGLNNNNPAEARVSQLSDAIKFGKPVMGQQQQLPGQAPANVQDAVQSWKPPVNLPQQLVTNPDFQARQQRIEQMQNAVVNKMWPLTMNLAQKNLATDAKLREDFNKKVMDTGEKWRETITKQYASLEATDEKSKAALDKQIEANAGRLKAAYAAKGFLDASGIGANPNMAGMSSLFALGPIKGIETSINKMQQDNRSIEGNIKTQENMLLTGGSDPKHPKNVVPIPPGERRDEMERQIREWKAQIGINNDAIDKMSGIRNDIIKSYGQPGGQAGTAQGAPTSQAAPAGGGAPATTAQNLPTRQPGATPFKPIGLGQVKIPTPQLEPMIQSAASAAGVDNNLFGALIMAESSGHPDATSPKGAQGLAQLTPETQDRWKVKDAYNPQQSLMGGAQEFNRLLNKYNDMRKAIAAYNSGEANVDKYKGVPPFPETQNYVATVLREYARRLQTGGGVNLGQAMGTGQPQTVGPTDDSAKGDIDIGTL